MKHLAFAALAVLLLAGLLAGCGKSGDQLKLEADLNAEVLKLHDAGMAAMKEATATMGGIETTLGKHDSLVKAFPKQTAGHPADDLTAATEKLKAARAAMDTWMKSYRPYDKDVKHDAVMAQMTKEKEALTKINADIQAAVTAGKAAIGAHQKAADDLMAAMKKHGRKAGK
jgi:hypothetical protein